MLLILAAATGGAVGCDRDRGHAAPAPASSAGKAVQDEAARRAAELLAIELSRQATEITEADLTDRDVRVRRAAARALSRISDARGRALLEAALSDEDTAVVTWAAFGLGRLCKGHEPELVRRLSLRAAALVDQRRAAGSAPPDGSELDPTRAIADALGRCASKDAERVLRGWLRGELADAAAQGLGRLAILHQPLDDATLVALLEAAERGVPSALFPFSRLSALPEAMRKPLLRAAEKALAAKDARAGFAVRALGRAGAEAAPLLGSVAADRAAPVGLAASAARELGRLAETGQAEIGRALQQRAGGDSFDEAAASEQFQVLLALIETAKAAPSSGRAALEALAALTPPEPSEPAGRQRIVKLRCAAAALLAGSASLSARLATCDPDQGRTATLALLRVLDQGKLTGARARRYAPLAESDDPVVRQAALRLLETHPEVAGAPALLTSALGAEAPGTVATAAHVLAAHPARGGAAPDSASPRPDPKLVEALTAAFDRALPADAIETRTALIDAAGSLQLLSLKPRIETLCRDPHRSVREHAARALKKLGNRQPQCDRGEAPMPEVPVLETGGRVSLTLDTDAGRIALSLDADLAPAATRRVVDLARAGFYDAMVVHRVVPGFVLQFGDRVGDGYGGAGQAPLPCELSPVPFRRGSVGVAISGRDTGSSQLFISLDDAPHLNGDYALIGHAEGPLDAIVEGARIERATVTTDHE